MPQLKRVLLAERAEARDVERPFGVQSGSTAENYLTRKAKSGARSVLGHRALDEHTQS